MNTFLAERRFALTLALPLIVLMIVAVGATTKAEASGGTRFNSIQGSVVVRQADEGDWFEAQINYPLGTGDRIWANNGARAEIIASNGAVLRINELTSLGIEEISEEGGYETVRLSLLRAVALLLVPTPKA